MTPPPTKMFYCGCHRDRGHYLWNEHEDQLSWTLVRSAQPWGDGVDGELCPSKGTANGFAKFTQRYGWSAISWWDNSVDRRPGSHSTFIAEGTHLASTLLEMARARFPWVFARLRYTVLIVGGSEVFE